MRYAIGCLFILILSVNTAAAQRAQFSGGFHALDVISFAQCELGLWAEKFRRPIPVDKDKASVSAEGTETITLNANAKGNWFVSAEGEYKTDVTQIAEIRRTRNIHPDNQEACIKNRPSVGVLQCLTDNAKNYPDDDVKCTTKVSATASASAGARFNLWVVGAEATGKLASTRSYTIVVTIPRP